MFFDVGVLLVPVEVGLVVLLLVAGLTVLLVGLGDDVVPLLLAVGDNAVDDTLLLVVGVFGLEVTVVVTFGVSLSVTVSGSGLNIIHSELTTN